MAKENATTTDEPTGHTVVSRGVKIAGETLVVPGSSLILDGDVVGGGAHLVGAAVAGAVLGPIGCLLVAANSYSKSVTGRHLHENIRATSAG